MQPSEIVSQASVLRFHAGHVCLTDNLVAIGDEAWIDRPAIGDIEIALPLLNNLPQ